MFVYRCKNVTVLGTAYRIEKCHMMVRVVQIRSGNVPQFGFLRDIITYGQQPSILFVFKLMETLGYDANIGAYVICPLSEFMILYRSSMMCHYLFNAVDCNDNENKYYVKSKYDLSVFCDYS